MDEIDDYDTILDAAIRRHNVLYGTDHCDPKYIQSCFRLPEIILSLPRPAVTDVGEGGGGRG